MILLSRVWSKVLSKHSRNNTVGYMLIQIHKQDYLVDIVSVSQDYFEEKKKRPVELENYYGLIFWLNFDQIIALHEKNK